MTDPAASAPVDEASEELPFDVHVERFPKWGLALAAITIVTAIATATGLLWSPFLVIPFIASTTARRFGVTPIDASIDADGLWLGDTLVAPRSDILDAWADPDDTDRRVSVAVKPDELIVVHLPNAAQARRFADELAPKGDARHVVAGYRPRAIDMLFPLRLFAVITSFVATAGVASSPAALLLFTFFAMGAYGFIVATQIDAGPEALELRSFFKKQRIEWKDVSDDMLAKIKPRVVRSPLLTTSSWTKNAHARVLAHAKRTTKEKRDS